MTLTVKATHLIGSIVAVDGKPTIISDNLIDVGNNTGKPEKEGSKRALVSFSRVVTSQTFQVEEGFDDPTDGVNIVEIPAVTVKFTSLENPVEHNYPILECYNGLKESSMDQKSLENFLLQLTKEINSKGKAPSGLLGLRRAVAWICSCFRFHGVFQTNCTSTATALVETLQTGILHRAIPDLEGADIAQFPCVGTRDPDNVPIKRFLKHFRNKITTPPGVNDCGIITLQRPEWYKRYGLVGAHAIAFARIDSHLYLMDPQKKKLWSLDLRKGISISASREAEKFLGSLNGKDDSIQVYHLDLPIKKTITHSAKEAS
ncbi:hypothetical protein SK355_09515 [Candidatus Fukatsuia symbiotica]|uniref:Uncharacterized protein n=1 Tax=Candidatus Fukatsuia symbiotica TaxID=1878942 RepID=A0A2U8I3F7_9GAMM|nr:hypothetical protein [Candidatus Fukatsuia symbiotica]AWK13638.1 hypothetical protein CCS41_02635 [Candidatus Fukatsuia symbiotica]MEA9445456.1 hypothetical protein [Candidatus Fukatsuia symbiotica]